MAELAAAILRAMGYKTRVMPKGPDRGVYVLASPDGLEFEDPRIKVEIKHRSKTSMGSSKYSEFFLVVCGKVKTPKYISMGWFYTGSQI